MSTYQIYHPHHVNGKELDEFLARGWFRSGSMLFISQYIFLGEDVYSPVRLRLPLAGYKMKKRLRSLYRKVTKEFSYIIRPASITAEKEALYRQHCPRFGGYVPGTLKENLLGADRQQVFDTREVCVYDGKKLIAVSFFDMGNNSMASILGLFDQAYSKFSLGMFTMLAEILYGQEQGVDFYYPGYVLPGNERFNYKLRLGNLEGYLDKGGWVSYDQLDLTALPVTRMKRELGRLAEALDEVGIKHKLVHYPPFQLDLGWGSRSQLRSPLWVYCLPGETIFPLVVDYDMAKGGFSFGLYQEMIEGLLYDIRSLFKDQTNDKTVLAMLERYKEVAFYESPYDMAEAIKLFLAAPEVEQEIFP